MPDRRRSRRRRSPLTDAGLEALAGRQLLADARRAGLRRPLGDDLLEAAEVALREELPDRAGGACSLCGQQVGVGMGREMVCARCVAACGAVIEVQEEYGGT